jgi:hypothetical protein
MIRPAREVRAATDEPRVIPRRGLGGMTSGEGLAPPLPPVSWLKPGCGLGGAVPKASRAGLLGGAG